MVTNRMEIDDLTFEVERTRLLLNRAVELLKAAAYGTKDTKVLAINEEIKSYLAHYNNTLQQQIGG